MLKGNVEAMKQNLTDEPGRYQLLMTKCQYGARKIGVLRENQLGYLNTHNNGYDCDIRIAWQVIVSVASTNFSNQNVNSGNLT